MKGTFQRLYADPWVARLYGWGRVVTVTGFSQVIVQGVGFVCGIVVIRMLPTSEYALYVLANTMVGTMSVLADGGISTGVISRGGHVWKDREQLGAVLASGFQLRKRFALASLLVAVPVMVVLLRNHGASITTTLLLVLAIIPAFISTISGSLYQIAPKLQQDVLSLQKNQVAFNLLRLLGSTVTLFFFPFAFLAILASGLAQVWSNFNLKKISGRYADWSQKPDAETRTEILRFVKRMLPGSLYYCISSQVSIWLISVFGSTSAVAEVGALGRLALVLGLFSVMVNVLIVPRFARLEGNQKTILAYYGKIQLVLFLGSAGFVLLSWLFGEHILWVLGQEYLHLRIELVLCTIGSCLNVIVGLNYILNSSRGWLLHPMTAICIGIAGIVGGVLLIDISTLQGVLIFNIFTGIVGLLVHPLYGLLRIIWFTNKD